MDIQLSIAGNYINAQTTQNGGVRNIQFSKSNSFFSNKYNTPIFDSENFEDQRQTIRNEHAESILTLTTNFKKDVDSLLEIFNLAVTENDLKAMQQASNDLRIATIAYNRDINLLNDKLKIEILAIDADEQKQLGASTRIDLISIDLKNDSFGNIISIPISDIVNGKITDSKNIAYDLIGLTQFLQNNTGGITP